MKKRIAILGSTGSIGANALDVVSRLSDKFEIIALTADSNINILAAQARASRPRIVSVGNPVLAWMIKGLVPSRTRIVFGEEGLKEIVSKAEVDLVLFATSGMSGLVPLIEAIRKKKQIALANKEALVSAGPVVMKLAEKNKVRIIPVDSEHSAIFQCLEGERAALSKIYLTGSGGPLLNIAQNKFDSLSRNFILKHPKWKMGKKISVDSATMMNKGLEIIEAKYLFCLDEKSVEVLIHPEAIIHSMVEFIDGSIMAQMAMPDMRIPIQYALTYPVRHTAVSKRINFSEVRKLSFGKPDSKKFPCLNLAREAARAGGTAPAVLCAADEEAVKNYLEGRIKFSHIPRLIEIILARHKNLTGKELTIGDVIKAEEWAREEARAICCH